MLSRAQWVPDARHLLVACVIAVAAAVLLPIAPVIGERPVVSWPQTPTAPASTALLLSNSTPESLDLRFSCAAALRAQAGDGVLLSTIRPEDPMSETAGFVVRVADSRITLATAGRQFPLGRADQGSCDVVARVDGAGLTVTRDGQRLVREAVPLPTVEGLITGVGASPGASSADLSVRVVVVDIFASSPTPLKWGLILLAALAALSVLVMLFWADRSAQSVSAQTAERPENRHEPGTGGSAPGRRDRLLSRLPDLLVIVVLLGWVIIAPTTDDDGYYAAMARNAIETGFVGNYYQMWNQSFTPFAWLWQALSVWQRIGGDSVVWLRLPALAAGVVTWFALRSFVMMKVGRTAPAAVSRWTGYVLVVAFLAWWLPYCMGVRPETVVAMFASLAMLLVAQAVETGRLSRAALAATLAGVAVAAHPTGFVVLAPLIVALPTLWRMQRVAHGLRGAGLRLLAVVAAATPAGIAAFGDGTWHDYVAGQARFKAVETPLDWTNEIVRYQFLLSEIPMGSYAKRVPVLLALTLLVWFLVLHVATRAARTPLPWRTSFAGLCLATSFVLLWLTPSKWTHHFGSLSGVGPALVTLLLVTGIPTVRELAQRDRRPGAIPLVFAVSLIPAMALSLQGPDVWAYWWNLGMPSSDKAPTLRDVPLGSPAFIIAAFLGVAAMVWLWTGRHPQGRSVRGFLVSAVVIVGFLGGTVLHLVGTFGLSTVRTVGTYSPGASNLEDPLGCSASKAVSVYDDRTARPLEAAVPPPEAGRPTPFVAGGGFWVGSPPPGSSGDGPTRQVWGSLTGTREEATGDFTSSWYALPNGSPDERVVTFVSGRPNGSSALTVEFGRRDGAAVTSVLQRRVADPEDSTSWRAETIVGGNDVPAGADVVRLIAHDGETNSGGWLAFTAPERQSAVPLTSYIPAHTPVTVSWQFALLFPCLDPVTIDHGITQPPEYAVTWPVTQLSSEVTWQVQRGGLTASAARLGSLVTPATFLTHDPAVWWGDLHRFRYPYSRAAYDLTVERQQVPGWRAVVPDSVSLTTGRTPCPAQLPKVPPGQVRAPTSPGCP